MPGFKRNLNLNLSPSSTRKKSSKNYIYHYRGALKIIGKEDDSKTCKTCHKVLPLTAFTKHTQRIDGAHYLQTTCRECKTEYRANNRLAKANAPPKPEQCNCCNKKTKELVSDHIQGSNTFRGWLCHRCNTGIGPLGDTLEGVLQGAVYLENDIEEIKKTLHKVYNEMFARTA